MNLRLSAALVVLATIALVSAEQFSYEGYKVWSITTSSKSQLDLLRQWQQNESVDFWEPLAKIGKGIRIMVKPDAQSEFVDFLVNNDIQNELIIGNLERSFAEERAYDARYRLQRLLTPEAFRNSTDFDHFWTLEELHNYIDTLEQEYPAIITSEIIGNSTEGRPLRLVKVSVPNIGHITRDRPIIFIDAGIHAREWLAPHAGLNILKQLVENHEENSDILDIFDFVFLPIVNPDGYQYSHDAVRLWRKTRTPFPVNENGRVCFGTDGNRNYEFNWLSAAETNTSTCSETYPGVGPFSEPETQAVHNVFYRYLNAIKMYISFHTYGNYVLYPWGYDEILVDNWQLHESLGHAYADPILNATGTKYTVGNGAIELYPAYGGSDDYAYFFGAEASFTIELPGGGRFGFDLPADSLQEAVDETWLGFRNMLVYAAGHEWWES